MANKRSKARKRVARASRLKRCQKCKEEKRQLTYYKKQFLCRDCLVGDELPLEVKLSYKSPTADLCDRDLGVCLNEREKQTLRQNMVKAGIRLDKRNFIHDL